MVEFNVGDTVILCASMRDFFCGTTPLYGIGDINISLSTCPINIFTPGCLNLSGIQLEFQWSDVTGTTDRHYCTESAKLKTLGTGTTNSQGVATIIHQIDEDDLELFQGAEIFDVRVCIKNKPPAEVVNISRTRDEFHPTDDITISPSEVTHVFDIIVKPHSWYTPSEATNGLLSWIIGINGELLNVFADILDWQYLGVNIFQDGENVVIRILLKELQISGARSLAFPAIPWGALILLAIFYIIFNYGWPIASKLIRLIDQFTSSGSLNNGELTQAITDSMKRQLEKCITEICTDIEDEAEKVECINNCKTSTIEENKTFIIDLYPDADLTPFDELIDITNQCYQDYLDETKTYEEYLSCVGDAEEEKIDEGKNKILEEYPPNANAGSKEAPMGIGSALLLGAGILAAVFILGRMTK